MNTKDVKGFTMGLAYACARLVQMHGETEYAAEIIQESGFQGEDFKHCAKYDLDFLRNAVPNLPKGIE